jgi:hypothetical protein
MIRATLIMATLLLASACSNPQTDLLSPCVGAEGSPCERRPVNDWWMKGQQPPQSDNGYNDSATSSAA